MRKVRPFFSLLLASFALFFMNSLFSCKNYDLNFEVRQSDSLIAIIDQATNALVIDNEYIRLRIDSMGNKLVLVSRLDTNRMSDELRQDILQYRALFKNYKDFITTYEALTYDNKIHSNYSRELKKKLLDNEVSKKDFGAEFKIKKNEMVNHLFNCKKLVKDLIGIEKMYQRLNTKLSTFLE